MKLDVLSDNELKYIAQQEKIENYSKLSREDLIDNLEEFYDDENNSESDKDVNNQALHRFCKGLVEFENVTQKALPGVQKLPEQYIETSIYLVEKDPFWAYVFWTISPNDKAKLYEDFTNFSIVIRNLIFDGNQIIDKINPTTLPQGYRNQLTGWQDKEYNSPMLMQLLPPAPLPVSDS